MDMASEKVTITLDSDTVRRIAQTAARLGTSKSGVVREAIMEYAAKAGRLSEAERLRRLAVLDELLARPATRSAKAVDREIAELRATRRAGGRATRSPRK